MHHDIDRDPTRADSFTQDVDRANPIPASQDCGDANAARLRELAHTLSSVVDEMWEARRAVFPPSRTQLEAHLQAITHGVDALKGAALELERTTVERERISELFDAAFERTEDPGLCEVLTGIERVLERAVIERDRQYHRAEYLENCALVQRSREEYARANEHPGANYNAMRLALEAGLKAQR